MFLRAFTSVQQAETAERDGKLKLAMSKYRFAASLLDQIGRNNPNWQPLIVGYRSRKTSEAITKLQQKIDVQTPPPSAAGPSPSSSPSTAADLPPPDAAANRPETASPPGSSSGPTTTDYFALPEPDRAGGNGGGVAASAVNNSNNNAAPVKVLPATPVEPPTRGMTRTEAAVNRATQEARAKIDRLQDELKNTRKQLDAARKDRETAQREQGHLKDQLEEAQGDLKTAVRKAELTRTDRDEIEAERARLESRLKETATKNPAAAAESRRELRQQLAALGEKLEKADLATKAAARERDELAAKYAAATKKNAAGTTGELSPEVNGRLESLAAENAALTQKLVTAEKTIADLSAEAAKKKEEAEAVQGELTKLRQQLADARDKNDRADTQIVELRRQLDESAVRMKEGLPREEATKLAKENELLRSISLRLLKQQNVRTQASKLLGEELARLEIQSKNVTDQLTILGQPTVQLTDEERALFKDPLIAISDDADGSSATMAASIVAVSPARRGGSMANTDVGGNASSSFPAGSPSPVANDGGNGANSPGGSGVAVVDANTSSASSTANANNTPAPASNPPVPDDLVPLAKEAKENLDQGRLPEAEAAYEKLVARAPKNVYGLSNLGVVLSRQGKLKSAETKLKKAVALAPKDSFSQATLGIVYYQMRRYDDAIDCLTKAIQLDPKTASAHNYLGITSFQKGWPEAAVEELDKALALRPDYADAHFNLAVVYALNQPPSKEKAQQHYRRATELGASPDPALEKLIN